MRKISKRQRTQRLRYLKFKVADKASGLSETKL